MEDRTRKNNLRFAGFSESGKESWDESEKKLKDFIQNKLGIKHNVTIGRAHRTGKINIEVGTVNKKRTIVEAQRQGKHFDEAQRRPDTESR